MSRRIVIIQAHPDPSAERFCSALAQAYRDGAESAGHVVETLRVAELSFPLVSSERDWQGDSIPEDIERAQRAIAAADHLVFVYPIWLGTMPALLKGFLEQVMRPGFAFDEKAREGFGERKLKGKSARVIATMGMPGLAYRLFYRGHGYFWFKRNVLKFCGIRPVRHSFVGLVAAKEDKRRKRWLKRVRELGQRGI